MRTIITLFIAAVFLSVTVNAQEFSGEPRKYKPFYIAIGLDLPQGNIGKNPKPSLTPDENLMQGYWGLKTGFMFEIGRKFYINSSTEPVRFGIDWTFLSFNYNYFDWDSYSEIKNGAAYTPYLLGVSTRLGPVVSYNPADKFIIDFRFQVAPALQVSPFEYYGEESGGNYQGITFNTDDMLKNFGVRMGGGLGVRWSFIGLQVDYLAGKMNTVFLKEHYMLATGETETMVEKKVATKYLQIRLNFNF